MQAVVDMDLWEKLTRWLRPEGPAPPLPQPPKHDPVYHVATNRQTVLEAEIERTEDALQKRFERMRRGA